MSEMLYMCKTSAFLSTYIHSYLRNYVPTYVPTYMHTCTIWHTMYAHRSHCASGLICRMSDVVRQAFNTWDFILELFFTRIHRPCVVCARRADCWYDFPVDGNECIKPAANNDTFQCISREFLAVSTDIPTTPGEFGNLVLFFGRTRLQGGAWSAVLWLTSLCAPDQGTQRIRKVARRGRRTRYERATPAAPTRPRRVAVKRWHFAGSARIFCGGKREATHGQQQWPRQGGGELIDAYCAPGSPTDVHAHASLWGSARMLRIRGTKGPESSSPAISLLV